MTVCGLACVQVMESTQIRLMSRRGYDKAACVSPLLPSMSFAAGVLILRGAIVNRIKYC